ncbi:hypothetical protein YYC_03183 [Plasmodium yoelii 17X]|uniref:Midasin n=1 Tax=Plasmodium yoelii 17X TaxID=1323249 RepID=V7PLF1_PLAYE|nr:hypothetical protein YYC_03183 [Plasmodium yoelii 17X]
MSNFEDKTALIWSTVLIREIQKRENNRKIKNSSQINKLNEQNEIKELKIEDNNGNNSQSEGFNYVNYIYKNCCTILNYFHHINIKKRKFEKLSKNLNISIFGQSSKCKKIKIEGEDTFPQLPNMMLSDNNQINILQSIIKKPSHNLKNKYKIDLLIVKTIILTLFEPFLLKVSLKYFNLLTVSIINQIFEEALILSSHDYYNMEIKTETVEEKETKSKDKVKQSHPSLHIYNFIKKYNIDIEIYFCMICMNSILFCKDLFYKNTIDYFFNNVLVKSEHAYNYFKNILLKYENNIKICKYKAEIYYTYLYKILLIYYYLSMNNILDKMHINLLPQVMKYNKNNDFFEALIYLIYLNYYRLEKNCLPMDMFGPNFNNTLTYNHFFIQSEKDNNDENNIFCDQTLLECKSQKYGHIIYDILTKHNGILADFEYIYIEKFRNNVSENSLVKFYEQIESVIYPSFCLKIRDPINMIKKNGNNFVITKRLINVIEELVINIYNKKPTILIGSEGSGKTSLIKYIYDQIFKNKYEKDYAKKENYEIQNVISIYLDDISDSKSILGLWESNENCFEFKYGILSKAMKNGDWVVFENINNISNSIVEKLQELTSKGYIYLSDKGEYIYPHKNFRLFSTITVNNYEYNQFEGEKDDTTNLNLKNEVLSNSNDYNKIFNDTTINFNMVKKMDEKKKQLMDDEKIRERILINHRPNNLNNLFNKWHSVFIGCYQKDEIKEILYKKLQNSIHENYKYILYNCYNVFMKLLNKYRILRKINLHDLIKIIKRVNKKKVFMYENEKTKMLLFQICKSILISHIPNANIRYIFLLKLIKLFGLSEDNVLTHLKNFSLENCINEFNITLKNKYKKISLDFNKIYNHSFLLTSVHKSIIYEIIEGVHNKESILLLGDTGVGKTALIDYISNVFGKKLHVFVFSEQSESSDLIGNYYPFNINVKTNEIFSDLKKLISKINSYLSEKEVNLFCLKLRILLTEKKYTTFLNTCYNFISTIIDIFQNDSQIFDMKIVKDCKDFQNNCKNINDFWNDNNDLNKKKKANYFLNYNFYNFFKKDGKIAYPENVHNGITNTHQDSKESEYKKVSTIDQVEIEEEPTKGGNELIFKFHDGVLIDCIQNGYWILLDEINLAQTEILQRLQGLLDSSNKYFDVIEKGNERIKIHKDFRLFACMNPPIIPNLKKGVKKKNKKMNSSDIENSNENNTVNDELKNGDKVKNEYDELVEALDSKDGISIDIYNRNTSSGKKDLPAIIRNKFTEIFVDEIVEYEDVEMIVKHILKDVTCDKILIKNITNCYLEIKKESLKNMNNNENKPISFSTRNLVRAIKFAIHIHKRKFKPVPLYLAVRNGFICNFLSSVNYNNHKILEKIFNKYLKLSQNKHSKNSDDKISSTSNGTMHIEKNGTIDYSILENYYQYTFFNTKNNKEEIAKNGNLPNLKEVINGGIEINYNNKTDKKGINGISNNMNENIELEKYVCVEDSWILCGNEDINLKNILSNFIITKNVRENIKKLALCLSSIKTPILLEGNTSVGKTSLVKFFADITGHKFIRINNHMNTDINEYYGQFVNDKNSDSLIFEEGAFVKAVRNGYWVVLDELNLAPSEVLESLNRILDDNKELYIPELKCYVKAHKDFMLFATQNPANNQNYFGRKELSKAFRSRFIEFCINDFETEELEIILHRKCAISPSISKKMIQVFTELKDVKSNYNYFNGSLMTLRDLIKWGNRNPSNNSDACLHGYYIIAEKLRNDKDKETVKNILCTNFMKKNESFVLNYEQDSDVIAFKNAFAKKISQVRNLQKRQIQNDEESKINDNLEDQKLDRLSDDLKRYQYLKNMHFGKTTSRLLALLCKCFKYKESALLIGETGCGKTTSCELLSFVDRLKLNILNCNESTDVYDIIGSLKLVENKKEDFEKLKKICIELYNEIYTNYKDSFASNYLSGIIHEQITDIKKEDFLIFNLYLHKKYNLNEQIKNKLNKMEKFINNFKSVFTWHDGILVSSLKKGDIFLMDEISLIESSVIERLNSVFEYERTLILTEKGGSNVKTLKAHDTFFFIGTMNPCGDFGKKELSQTLKNRFTEIFVQTYTYDSDDFYYLILKQIKFTKKKNIKHNFAKCLCNLFQEISQSRLLSSYVTLSIRDAIKWITFMNLYINRRKKQEKNKNILSLNKLKQLCIESFYHSGCLILIDGNEDMKCKNEIKYLLTQHLEKLSLSIKSKTNEKMVTLINQFDKTDNFIFTKKYLKINNFEIKFKKKLLNNLENISNDNNFVFDTPNIKINLFKIIRAMQLNNSILLEGSPGVGKTCIINILAKLTKNKLIRINLSECTDIYDFIGSYFPIKDKKNVSKDEEIDSHLTNVKARKSRNQPCKIFEENEKKKSFQYYWKDGKLIECMKKGYWILIDEINLANQQTLEGLNSILDHRNEIYIPETNQMVKGHKNFRLFCCQNPYKEGAGRKGLPKSFLNRFSKIYFEELNEEDYVCIVENLYKNYISVDMIKKIIKIILIIKKINILLHESEGWIWNLRDILRICKFLKNENIKNKYNNSFNNFIEISDRLISSRLNCIEDKLIVRSIIINVYYDSVQFLTSIKEVGNKDALISLVNNKEKNNLYYIYENCFNYNTRNKNINLSASINASDLVIRPSLILLKDEQIYYSCLLATQLNVPILLNGKNNSGKSSFVHKLAYMFQKKLFEFALTNDIDTFDLFGCYEHNSRENAIISLEKKIYKLNRLILRHIFKRSNLRKFYMNYFNGNKNDKCVNFSQKIKSRRVKIYIMKTLNILSVNYIEALKSHRSVLQKVQTRYVNFIKCFTSCATYDSAYTEKKINRILQNILYSTNIINKNDINENVYVYNEGNFIKAIKKGHWVLLKHLHHSTPSLLDRLNSLFEENGYILLHEFGKKKKIKPHKNFQIFLTLSSEEHYKISKALRNRCLEIYFGNHNEYQINPLNISDPKLYGTMSEEIEETTKVRNFNKNNGDSILTNLDTDLNNTSFNNYLVSVVTNCYNSMSNKSSNSKELGSYKNESEMNKKVIKDSYLSIIKETNIFIYIIKLFFKYLEMESEKKYNIKTECDEGKKNKIIKDLIFFFFKDSQIKVNCKIIIDYINYCYNAFFNTHGVKYNKDIIYFCLIISLSTYVIEYICSKEMKEYLLNFSKDENISENYKFYKNYKNNLNILLNYKFDNNIYYIDKYIDYICSKILIKGENNNNIGKLNEWKYIFIDSFSNFYCQIFSKLTEKLQLYFYPFFSLINHSVIKAVYKFKTIIYSRLGSCVATSNNTLNDYVVSKINNSKFVYRSEESYLIYFYIYIFINYISNYNKGNKTSNLFFKNTSQYIYKNNVLKEAILIDSLFSLKLNKIFCHLVYCFIYNFSLCDLFYRYDHLLNIKNKIIVKKSLNDKFSYDTEMINYLEFVTKNIIYKKITYFYIMANSIYSLINNGKNAQNCMDIRKTINDNDTEQVISNQTIHKSKKENIFGDVFITNDISTNLSQFFKPLILAKRYLINRKNQRLSKVVYFCDEFLKYNFSYNYFIQNRKIQENSEEIPSLFYYFNKIIITLEKAIFKIIKGMDNSNKKGKLSHRKHNTYTEKIFSYYLFMYIYIFEAVKNLEEKDSIYNTIIIITSVVKIIFSTKKKFYKINIKLLEILKKAKLLSQTNLIANDNMSHSFIFQNNETTYNNYNITKSEINVNNIKKNNFLILDGDMNNIKNTYFSNKWINNIFEIVNNIYVSYYIYIRNKINYLSFFQNLQLENIEIYDNEKNLNKLFPFHPKKIINNNINYLANDIENFLIQTKSFSNALKILNNENNNSKIKSIENLIINNFIQGSSKIDENLFSILNTYNLNSSSFTNSLNKINITYDNLSNKLHTNQKGFNLNWNSNSHLLFYFQFIMFNINMKYLYNSFIYLMNFYMTMKFYNHCNYQKEFQMQRNETCRIIKNEECFTTEKKNANNVCFFDICKMNVNKINKCIKETIKEVYIYLENIDNTMYIYEEKIEILSFLKEKYNILVYAEKKRKRAKKSEKNKGKNYLVCQPSDEETEINIIYTIIEEIVFLIYSYLMNIYMVRDINYNYVKKFVTIENSFEKKTDHSLSGFNNNFGVTKRDNNKGNFIRFSKREKIFLSNLENENSGSKNNYNKDNNNNNCVSILDSPNVPSFISQLNEQIITYEEYTIFKNIYFDYNFEEISKGNNMYSNLSTSIFNRSVIFDSVINMYKEIKNNKNITLLHLNMSNFIFNNLKQNYYHYILKKDTPFYGNSFFDASRKNNNINHMIIKLTNLNLESQSTLRYYFILHTFSIFNNIFENNNIENQATNITNPMKIYYLLFFQIYQLIIFKRENMASPHMIIQLLELYKYIFDLKNKVEFIKKIEKYLTIFLFILFKIVIINMEKYLKKTYLSNDIKKCGLESSDNNECPFVCGYGFMPNNKIFQIAHKHIKIPNETPLDKIIPSYNSCENSEINKSKIDIEECELFEFLYKNNHQSLDINYIYNCVYKYVSENNNKINPKKLNDVVNLLFSNHEDLINLIKKYEDEEFLYALGSLYISHYFLNIICSQIRKEIKEIFKKVGLKNYIKKLTLSTKEQIYMNTQQNIYNEKINPSDELTYNDFFNIKKNIFLKKEINNISKNIPLLPKLLTNVNKKKKKKIYTMINTSMNKKCNYLIAQYIYKNNSENVQNLYIKLKNDFNKFLKNILSYDNIQSLLNNLNNTDNIISYSIINSSMNFLYHIKKKYNLILKFTHSTTYALCAFIHSVHNINLFILQKREKYRQNKINTTAEDIYGNYTSISSPLTLYENDKFSEKNPKLIFSLNTKYNEKPAETKQLKDNLYEYTKFPINFNKIINLKREQYEKISELEYFEFVVKMLQKSKNIYKDFDFKILVDCLKKLCRKIIYSQMDEDNINNINDLFKIDQFKNFATKEKAEYILQEDYIDKKIEIELDNFFYSPDYFSNEQNNNNILLKDYQMDEEKKKDIIENESNGYNFDRNHDSLSESNSNDSIHNNKEENLDGNFSKNNQENLTSSNLDEEKKEVIDENIFNSIVYKIAKLFKKKKSNLNHDNKKKKKNEINMTQKNISNILDMLIKLGTTNFGDQNNYMFLLSKKSEEKEMLIFTLNMMNKLSKMTKYKENKFEEFKNKILDILLSEKKGNHIYVNRYINLLDENIVEYIYTVLNDLCLFLINIRKEFILIYNENNNLNILNIINLIDSILSIPINNIKKEVEKIIVKLESIINTFGLLKSDNFINFDEINIHRLNLIKQQKFIEQLLMYTIYFRLYKINEIKNIRKNLNRKIVKKKTLNLFSFLFYLCYDDNSQTSKEDNRRDESDIQGHGNIQDNMKLKIIKTFETLVIFLRESTIGEFTARLNLICLIAHLFGTSKNIKEKIMSTVFLNVYNYMSIYSPLIQKKIKMCKNYFDLNLKKSLQRMNLDLISVDAYKSSIIKLKKVIVYYTKLYFQQINITMDKFIQENRNSIFVSIDHNEKADSIIEENNDNDENENENSSNESELEIGSDLENQNPISVENNEEEITPIIDQPIEALYISNELNGMKKSFLNLAKKIKNKLNMNKFLNYVDNYYSFEELSKNFVDEIKNVLNVQSPNANMNQKKRWIYILKHFIKNKLNIPILYDLNNFNFFSDIFKEQIYFDNIKNGDETHISFLLEYSSSDEILRELKNCLMYIIENDNETGQNELDELVKNISDEINNYIKRKKVNSLCFLDKIKNILKNNEERNYKILYLIIYIKSINIHEDIRNDEVLTTYLLNSINYEYYNLRREINIFYHHFVFYYLIISDLLFEKKYEITYFGIDIKTFEEFILKCNEIKSSLLQILSIFSEQLKNNELFKNIIFSVYKIIYIIYNSNEFAIFKFIKNMDTISCLEPFKKNCISNFKIKVNENLWKFVEKNIKNLEDDITKIFYLDIGIYFKNKIYQHIYSFISFFKQVENPFTQHNDIINMKNDNIEKNKPLLDSSYFDNINNQIVVFINNIINNKSILYKNDEYPNFQESKNVNTIYSFSDIIEFYLNISNLSLLKSEKDYEKKINTFYYMSKNLFYFVKSLFLYFLDIYIGFSNITLYFLKLLKVLYIKGLCKQVKDNNEATENSEESKNNDIFHKIDFIEGVGLGEGKGVKNISSDVDNEDLDNIYNEDENNFSQDEQDFNEEAIESTYNFKKFCEKEISEDQDKSTDTKGDKKQLQNEQDNINMDKDMEKDESNYTDKIKDTKQDENKNQNNDENNSDQPNQNDREQNIDDVFEKNNGNNISQTKPNENMEKNKNSDNPIEQGKQDTDFDALNIDDQNEGQNEGQNEDQNEDQKAEPKKEHPGEKTEDKSKDKLDEKIDDQNNDMEFNGSDLGEVSENDNIELMQTSKGNNNFNMNYSDEKNDNPNDNYSEIHSDTNEDRHENFDDKNGFDDNNFESDNFDFEIESSDFSKSLSVKSFISDEDQNLDEYDNIDNTQKDNDTTQKDDKNLNKMKEREDVDKLTKNDLFEQSDISKMDEEYAESDFNISEQNENGDLEQNENNQNVKNEFMRDHEKEGEEERGSELNEIDEDVINEDEQCDNQNDKYDENNNANEQNLKEEEQKGDELVEGKTDEIGEGDDELGKGEEDQIGKNENDKVDNKDIKLEGENEVKIEELSKKNDENIEKQRNMDTTNYINYNEQTVENDKIRNSDENTLPNKQANSLNPNKIDNINDDKDKESGIDGLRGETNEMNENDELGEQKNTLEKNNENGFNGNENNTEKDDQSNSNTFSFSINKYNIYTENFMDISNFIEKINEKLHNLNETDFNKKEDERENAESYQKKGINNFDTSQKNITNSENIKPNSENKNENESGNQINENDATSIISDEQNDEFDQKNICEMNESNGEIKEIYANKNKQNKTQDEMKTEKKHQKTKINDQNNETGSNYDEDDNVSSIESEKMEKDNDRRNYERKDDLDFEQKSFSEDYNYDDELKENEEDLELNDKNKDNYKMYENKKGLEREYRLKNENENFEDKIKYGDILMQNDNINNTINDEKYEKIYEQLNNETEMISSQLCEQLKIILEPTVRNKYEGDYKSGKKLNIKKLVNYFASNFRNNKIWKRKTKLNKRDYNILIAIDNTKSMKINNIQKMTLNAIFLVAKAFEKLNVGKIGICSFGESEQITSNNIVCPMVNSLNKQNFLKILNHFNFNHDTQNSFDCAMLNALKICNYVFKNSYTQNNSKNTLNHLMLIISDGRFNKSSVRAEIFNSIKNNFIPILMIIDTQLSDNKAQSIFNLKQTFYKNNKLEIVPYLHDFPFPYFVVVNDINDIPSMTCDIIRQWFEVLNNK